MFTDIVGYARISQANESLALELLEEHRTILRPTFSVYGGTEVKTIGDAFLIEFRSALEAVSCAVELQKKMAERNAKVELSHALEMRIGVHVGDVVHTRGDIYGDAVNVASRIAPLAEPGGVCISQQVYDQVRNKVPVRFEKAGDFGLKNIDVPLAIYKVVLADRGVAGMGERVSRERLAVLPLVSMSQDPNDEYFADGITEELIWKLSELEGLKVIARTSVMGYKKKDKKVSEIASELRVGSVIEGSVRKAGDRVRISVQLVDAGTEEHLWSSKYDGKLDDIFAIQTDVAVKVAAALSATIFPGSRRRDTSSIEAYTLYLRARQSWYDITEEGLRSVLDFLQRAIAKDPEYARAYASLAEVKHRLAFMGYEDFGKMAQDAEAAAVRALELDPQLAEAHTSMAEVHSMLDRFDAALLEAETAVRINPNLSEAYMVLGGMESLTRTAREAAMMYKKACELDPLSPWPAEMLASAARWSGDPVQADEALERMRELSPDIAKTYLIIADHLMEKREFEEAQRMVDQARVEDPNEPMTKVSQALLFALTGRRDEAEAELGRIPDTGNMFFRSNGTFLVRTALGDFDEAFESLTGLAEAHSWPASIRIDPFYSALRRDPRFAEFCKTVGIRP